MDLSKLPKLSQSAPAEPPASSGLGGKGQVPARPEPVADYAPPVYRRGGNGAEAWISIAVGLIVLLMQQPLLTFMGAKLGMCAFTATYSDETGQPMAYTQSVFFALDLGLGLFGLALIADGLLMFTRRRLLWQLGLGLTLITTVWNVWTVGRLYGGYGLQIMPALAAAFGVYMAIWQWRKLKLELLTI